MVSENCSEKRREKSRHKRDRGQEKQCIAFIPIFGVQYSNECMEIGVWLLNWFLEACSVSRARSLINCPHSWFFSGGPDIIVSQTGSDTRGIVYRLQMVVLRAVRTQTCTDTQEFLSTAETKNASVSHGCPAAGKDLYGIFQLLEMSRDPGIWVAVHIEKLV